ncbi:hypothetical protein AAF712_003455 [Marasmius tenuissimus]|uniref:Bulb-type lectin domain-containing protein n=1 Tax=Marasmius tenuissimus TaxID=585030 RepID=A0ABR3A7D3_9AGAR|nr:hypothetical protein PM082_003923 [Marasmius tenuissimus]
MSFINFVYAAYRDKLPENGVIGRGYGLQSPNKRVQLNLTFEGNLELIGDGSKLWSVDGKDISFVKMQGDGNCVGYKIDSTPVWATVTNGPKHPYNLICQDDGNLVLYAKDNNPVWATNTNGKIN